MLATAVRASGFSGNFNGIAAAAGMTLNLQEAEARVAGRLMMPGGRVYALGGERNEKGAQGALRIGGSADVAAFFRLEERPLGMQLLFIPVEAGGRPDVANARDYSFVAEGVAVSAKSRFLAAPPAGAKADVLRFIDEYRQWDPRDVARVYATLGERDRGLIQLYDHAAADLLWRVCAARAAGAAVPEEALADLLDRQQTDCDAFLPFAEAARQRGLFAEFLRRARFQFEIVRETVVCNRGQSSPARCADVSALGAPQIVNWRDASSIMRDLAGLPASGEEASRRDPPLRAAIVDTADVPAAKARPGKPDAAALRTFVAMRRSGIRLPLPDPRR